MSDSKHTHPIPPKRQRRRPVAPVNRLGPPVDSVTPGELARVRDETPGPVPTEEHPLELDEFGNPRGDCIRWTDGILRDPLGNAVAG